MTTREAVLNEFADERLAAQAKLAEDEKRRKAMAKKAAKLEAERQVRVAASKAQRDKALEEAEAACRELVAAIGRVQSLSKSLALTRRTVDSHLGVCLSAELKPVETAPGYIGTIKLARTWRKPGQPWSDTTLPPMARGNGHDPDTDTEVASEPSAA